MTTKDQSNGGTTGGSGSRLSTRKDCRRKGEREVMTTAHFSKTASSLFALSSLLVASCASSGTEPHAMTAAQHEAATKSETRSAKEHAAQYDPSQIIPPTMNCPFALSSRCYSSWTSVLNPTERHFAEGKRHAELASQHRAASQALRDAEASACKSVPEGDRDVSPFYHREDIVSAGPFAESLGLGGKRVIGAEVVFAALPGMTVEWLQRVVDCHLARNAVLDDAAKVMPYCPLTVPHVKAQVRSVGNGFAVDITSNDDKSVKTVIALSDALSANPR